MSKEYRKSYFFNRGPGYSEQQITDNIFKVKYRSSAYMNADLTFKYFLRRCAEITQENNKQYFKLKNEDHKIESYKYNSTGYIAYQFHIYTGLIKLSNKKEDGNEWVDADMILKIVK
jgi:hypothetical protein